MASSSFPTRDAQPSLSSQGGSLEDQLLEEREHLKNEINRIHGDHKKAVDLLRAGLEKELQDANALILSSREEIARQLKANQELMRQQDIETQKKMQSKNALTAAEEQISRLTKEKSKLVLLLDTTQSEISDLRGTITKQSLELSQKFGQVELLKMTISSKDSEIEFLKISERGLKCQTEELRSDVSTLHSHLLEKDKEISRVRAEGDRRLKDVTKENTRLDSQLWQMGRSLVKLEESVRQEKENVQRLEERERQFGLVKERLQDELREESAAHQEILQDLKKHLTAFRVRNQQLEEEKKTEETYRAQLEQAYNEAVAKVQEEMKSVRSQLEERSSEVEGMRQEVERAAELLSYLKHDTGHSISPELQHFVRAHGFSVPRLYHQYRIVLEKLAEAENLSRSLQTELESRNQEWQQYLAEQQQEETTLQQLTRQLQNAHANQEQQTSTIESLRKQGETYLANLRKLEQENGSLKEKVALLQRHLSAVLDADTSPDTASSVQSSAGKSAPALQFRSTQGLVEVNTSLYSAMESLKRENFQLKEQIEAASKTEEEYRQAVEIVRGMVEQKEPIERRLTELANEVQLYRRQNESSLVKDFLRCAAALPSQMESFLSLAGNESALFAFIRAHGGSELAEKFAAVQRETQTLRQDLEEAKAEVEKRKSELDRLSATQNGEVKAALDSRDRALSELKTLKSEVTTLKRENEDRAAEAARQLASVSQLYERLCLSERESAALAHEVETQKEQAARVKAECQMVILEKSTLVSRVDVLTEQQTSMQKALNQQTTTMQEWQLRESGVAKDLQEALQVASQAQAASATLQRDLESERSRVQSLTKELVELKKQLEDVRLGSSRPSTTPTTTSTVLEESSNLPSSNTRGGSDFALNIIRQSSVQQDVLQQKIGHLQTEVEKAQTELAVKTRQLEVQEEESVKRMKEMKTVKTSMLTDIHHIKEDREVLRSHLNQLQTEKLRLVAENEKLTELVKRQEKEMGDVMTRYMTELQSHETSAVAAAHLRKELHLVKQSLLATKRREQYLEKALEELRRQTEKEEKVLREEVRLLEEERENAKGWKRALYDEARPASTSLMSDDVQDLTILVEHQKKENESISKQLQLAKEEGFANAAKVKSLMQSVSRLQEEMELVMEKEDSSALTSWHESYTEQQNILASTMEVNAKLRSDLTSALHQIDDLKTSFSAATRSVDVLTARVREVEEENVRLVQESKTLNEQLETWNSRFGVNQQKDEIETLKKTIAQLENQIKNQGVESERKREGLKASFTRQMREKLDVKTKEHNAALQEIGKRLEILQSEVSTARVALTEKQTEMEKVVARNSELRKEIESLEATHFTIVKQRQELETANAQLKEQLSRLSGKGVVEEAELPPRQTVPPPVQVRSTAVVTPQTQVASPLLSRPTVSATRPPHPPVAAVAPQAQEPEVPAVATVEEQVAGPSRRRPAEEEQSETRQSPARKRQRIPVKASGSTTLLQLRPPSPTSMSDVTSSTTVAPPLATRPVPPTVHEAPQPGDAAMMSEAVEQAVVNADSEGAVDSSGVEASQAVVQAVGVEDAMEMAPPEQDAEADNEVEMDEAAAGQGLEEAEEPTDVPVTSPGEAVEVAVNDGEMMSGSQAHFPDEGTSQTGAVETVEDITSSAAPSHDDVPSSVERDNEEARPVVEFPPEDNQEADIDSEVLDQLFGPLATPAGGGDAEEGEISDREEDVEEAETAAQGEEDEDAGDNEGALSEQASSTAVSGGGTTHSVVDVGTASPSLPAQAHSVPPTGSLPTLRRKTLPLRAVDTLRPSVVASQSSGAVAPPVGSGSPQRVATRRAISPPRQSGVQSESGVVSAAAVPAVAAGRHAPRPVGIYQAGVNPTRRAAGAPPARGEGRAMRRGSSSRPGRGGRGAPPFL